jgi:type I restriction enzyme S subunit
MTDKACTFKLGELVEIKHGFAFESAGFSDNGEYALLTPGNFHEAGGFRSMGDLQKKYAGPVGPKWVLSPGAVLIAMTEQAAGLLGSALRVPEQGRWLHNQRMGLVEIKHPDRLDLGFLFHWFNSPTTRQAVSVAASGTKVRHSSPSQLHSLDICPPSLKRQQIVARALDAWDSAMADAQELANYLERRKQGLMQHLLTGRQRLKGSKGAWQTQRLGNFLTRVTRKNSDGCTLALTVSAQRGLVEQGSYFAKQMAAEDNEHYLLLQRGEFAYNRSAALGCPYGAIKRLDDFDEGIVSTLCLCFGITDPQAVHTDYLNAVFDAGLLNRQLRAIAHEGARSHGLLNVTSTDFFKMQLSLPPTPEQAAIAEVLNEAAEAVRLQRQQLQALQQQKHALLQRLLSGEPA